MLNYGMSSCANAADSESGDTFFFGQAQANFCRSKLYGHGSFRPKVASYTEIVSAGFAGTFLCLGRRGSAGMHA